MNNLFALPEFEPLYDKFALYNYIRIRTEDEILKLRLIGIDFSGDSVEKIDVTFSEQIESVDGRLSDLQSIIQQAKSMAASYPSTALQAKQGAEANNEIADIYDKGLNAEKTMFANNDNNEVTITQSGIICKRMDNEGFYDGKQLRITGNVMAFTDDDWKSVKMAIGETTFKDSDTLEEKAGYGIIADHIVGRLIASDKCIIGNKENNVVITGDGIDIMNGSISLSNDEYSIEIDPKHSLGSTLDDYLFCIRNKSSSDEVIMGVNTSGNGYFKGIIDAKEGGRIANFNISENELYTDGYNSNFTENKGIYFGQGGLMIKDKFKVDRNGNLTANSGNIGGWNVGASKLSCNSDNGGNLNLDAENGSIYSIYGKNKATLTYGYVGFEYNSNKYMTLQITSWKDKPDVHGVGINSESESKYISFGNKNKDNDDFYTTHLVLNYGLNPNGDTQDVLIYGSTLLTGETVLRGNLYFNNNAYLNGYGNNTIFCSDNLEVLGNLYVDGATESTFTSAPNLYIASGGKIAKTSGSSKRFKTEIKPVDADELNPNKLYDVDIVQYKFKTDYLSEEDQRYDKEVIGFIAEDIYEKYPIAADYTVDDDGNTIVNDWNFRYMVPAMLKLIQDQKKEIDSLEKRLIKSEQEIEKLKSNK